MTPEQLLDGLLHGNAVVQRRAMAKAITLLESTRADHRAMADALLTAMLPHTGQSFRLGISGVPGVGKSTFIEALGLYLMGLGHRVAVLAVDPSSSVSGGSILGDKTRMEHLSVHPQAYIRPSPSSGTLGGVAEKTRESMLVCEAAGYDVVMVETVGVGQVEVEIAGKADTTVVVLNPGWGDSVQANKAGLMEIADIFVINKADRKGVEETRRDVEQMLELSDLPHEAWRPPIIATIGNTGEGVPEMWDAILEHRSIIESTGELKKRRDFRLSEELREIVARRLEQRAREITSGDRWDSLQAQVLDHAVDPWTAADEMLKGVGA